MSLTTDDQADEGDLRYDLSRGSEWVRMPRQARSEETLVRFLDATAELLVERSFDEISVNDIVERAERTVGSFYARFDDKSGVLRVLCDQVAARLCDNARGYWVVDRWHESSIDEIIEASVDAVITAYRESGPVFHAAAILAPDDEGFRNARSGVWAVCAERFAEVVADHADELDHPRPQHAAQLAIMAIIAMADLRLIYGTELHPHHRSDDEWHADLVTVVRSMLQVR